MAFKVEVIADSSGKWCANGLVFATKEAAEEYARDLMWRWTAVREWRAVETDEAPNIDREPKDSLIEWAWAILGVVVLLGVLRGCGRIF